MGAETIDPPSVMRVQQNAEYQLALNDPRLAYDTPDEIVHTPNLSEAQKIQILNQWEYDVLHSISAPAKHRPGDARNLSSKIQEALRRLSRSSKTGKLQRSK